MESFCIYTVIYSKYSVYTVILSVYVDFFEAVDFFRDFKMVFRDFCSKIHTDASVNLDGAPPLQQINHSN